MTSPPTNFYVDSSAYIAALLNQPGGKEIDLALRDVQVWSSVLLVLETNRTLVHLARLGVISSKELRDCTLRLESDLDGFRLEDVRKEHCMSMLMPVTTTPRSLDLAHLRTAIAIHHQHPLTRFVSLDQTQLAAAHELGLPT